MERELAVSGGGGVGGGGGGALVGAWTGFQLCGGAMVNRSYTSPPPLPQRSPRVRRRHNLHNYTALSQRTGTLRNAVVLALPHLTLSLRSTRSRKNQEILEEILEWLQRLELAYVELMGSRKDPELHEQEIVIHTCSFHTKLKQ